MIDFSQEMDGKVGVLKLEGDVTIQHASKLKEALIGALSSVDNIFIDTSAVEAVDLSCLQLLCGAHRAATALQKSLQLADPVPRHFRNFVEAAGFKRHAGCRLDVMKSCIWAGLFRQQTAQV